MDAIESRVVGQCEGYRWGRVFVLDDGTSWEQVSERSEFVLRNRPKARVYEDDGGVSLDLEGTSGVVLVRRWIGKRWAGPAAY